MSGLSAYQSEPPSMSTRLPKNTLGDDWQTARVTRLTYHRNPIRSASRPMIGEKINVPNELTDTAQPTMPTLPPTCNGTD
jgi:hypothetical protein